MNHLQAGRAVSALRPRGPVLPAALAIIYVVAWVAGLMVSPAGADVTASTAQVITSDLAQRGVTTASYLLTEGVAAVALAGVVITLWQAARRRHAGSSASLTLSAGLVAAGISMLQCVTGLFIVWWSAPSGQIRLAGTLLDLVNRIDGLKMGVLAVMAISALALVRRPRVLPHISAYLGLALAIALVASGVGYLLLIGPLLRAAFVSLPLLLLWVLLVGCVLSFRVGRD